MSPFWRYATCIAVGSLPSLAAAEQETTPGLSLELNAARQVEAGRELSFLVTNDHGADLETVVFEPSCSTRAGRWIA